MVNDNVSLSEVLWLGMGIVALVLNLLVLWRAIDNLRALVALDQNGGRRLSAWTAIGIQAGLTLPHVVVIVTGLVAMSLPPTLRSNPQPPTAILIVAGLLLIELILLAVSAFTWVRWQMLDAYFARAEGALAAESAAVAETRHTESMAELVHNTEITTEARDGAEKAYMAANDVNSKIINVQIEIAETNKVAGESAESLQRYMEKLEGERQDREGC